MRLTRPDLAAYALAAFGILCITVLLFVGRTVPDYLPLIVMTAMGAGGGLALNTPAPRETIRTGPPAPAQRASLPPRAAVIPEQPAAPAPAAAAGQ